MMTPIETGARHYRGPEAAAVPPPPPSLPPAEVLPTPSPAAQQIVQTVDDAFVVWIGERSIHPQGNVTGLLFEAFKAGVAWQARQVAKGPIERTEAPLEGTVESRTIIAALTFFREQILAHRPEEVKTGEWMTATDVDALIAKIQENAR